MSVLDRLPRNARPIVWPTAAIVLLIALNLIDIGAVLAFLGGSESEAPLFTLRFLRVELNELGHLSGPLISILVHGSKIMLLALGMTLVIATGGIDLSVGAVFAIAGACAAQAFEVLGTGTAGPGTVLVVVVGALAICMSLGIWNGFLVSSLGIQPIVATFVLMVAGRGVARIINDGQVVFVREPHFLSLGGGYLLGVPAPVCIALLMFCATWILLRRTALGLFIEAVGNNRKASRLVGIRSGSIEVFVYAYCALCAGVGGVVFAAFNESSDPNTSGLYLELDAILAVVIGGTSLMGGRFFLVGSMVGALLIQTLNTTILFQGFGIEYTLFVKSIVIIAVCLVQAPALHQAVRQRLWKKARV